LYRHHSLEPGRYGEVCRIAEQLLFELSGDGDIAYNIFLRFNDMVPISFRAFRIHRVLGFGNTQTLLGIINGPTGQW